MFGSLVFEATDPGFAIALVISSACFMAYMYHNEMDLERALWREEEEVKGLAGEV
ncbi:hypothetical protein YB2330_000031 [Saitoella coloradoensis]